MTPGAGRAGRGSFEADAADRHVVTQPHEVVLEGDFGPGRAQGRCLGQGHPCAQGVVRHGQQAHRDGPPGAQ